MSKENDEGLVKVFVDLPNHWATSGESMWAKPLGNDLYELRNTPFYAYGLNWGDIVRAEAREPDFKPEVLSLITPSGNRTLRVYFKDKLSRQVQNDYLHSLKNLGFSFERATDMLVALDIEAGADYQAICNKIWELEQEGILEYETCEPRVQGSFDDGPDENEEEIT